MMQQQAYSMQGPSFMLSPLTVVSDESLDEDDDLTSTQLDPVAQTYRQKRVSQDNSLRLSGKKIKVDKENKDNVPQSQSEPALGAHAEEACLPQMSPLARHMGDIHLDPRVTSPIFGFQPDGAAQHPVGSQTPNSDSSSRTSPSFLDSQSNSQSFPAAIPPLPPHSQVPVVPFLSLSQKGVPPPAQMRRSDSVPLGCRRLFSSKQSSPMSNLRNVDEDLPFQDEVASNSLSSVSKASSSVFADHPKFRRSASTGMLDDLVRRFKSASLYVVENTQPTSQVEYKCKLPLKKEDQHTGCGHKVIGIEVVADLLKGKYKHFYDRVFIIDCRSPEEYKGGHIRGAMHKQQVQDLHEFFHNSRFFGGRTAFVFHCEFSRVRGPKGCSAMRELDSRIHGGDGLCFPEVYLMKDGYSKFYEQYGQFCDPCGYRRMDPELNLYSTFQK